jgi:rSAM/selenodomain-associated transferase 1
VNRLLIFIKNPAAGKVKTRLAASIGPEAALAAYRMLLSSTRATALGVPAERWLFYSDFIDNDDDWRANDFRKFAQEGRDLGERMRHAFELALGDGAKAVIIGSDCPWLTPALVEEAFRLLDHFPFVIGPAADGGYYLLGMTRPAPALFEGMPWSTPDVLPDTLSRIEGMESAYALLPALSDIDTQADWERFQRQHLKP